MSNQGKNQRLKEGDGRPRQNIEIKVQSKRRVCLRAKGSKQNASKTRLQNRRREMEDQEKEPTYD
jgi:hypothetical protein